MLKNYFRYILDFFYPHICLICRKRIVLDYNAVQILFGESEYCCAKCAANLELAPRNEAIFQDFIRTFERDELAISNATSLFYNSSKIPIINLVYGLKYQGFMRIGVQYGQWLAKILVDTNLTNYDYIIPVPIHKARVKERGYNQSDYIAQGIAKVINIPIAYNLLIRTKYTTSQTILSPEERLVNPTDAFAVTNQKKVYGKRILLVDDVLTTGSTLNNCAITLLENCAVRVDVATLIKA
ncbi:MAG: ComF family protein [Ignavibacteria bacterium]|jgi:ComF family protein|nr:ComF family protein [Ignavibacteria bacterium]